MDMFMANMVTTTNRTGAAAALGAYTLWGIFPLLWKWIQAIPVNEILAFRVIGNFLLLFLLVLLAKQSRLTLGLMRQGKSWRFLFLSGALITVNWGIYVYAVISERLLEASLGYFINPLLNVALGVFFFQETLTRNKKIALLLSAGGVGILLFLNPIIPWLGFAMCLTFAGYGLLRKLEPLPLFPASLLECAWIMPLALIYLVWLWQNDSSLSIKMGPAMFASVLFVSILSATPLVLFAAAAKRLPLSTLGFFQYISPSLQFFLAIFAFHETLLWTKALAFICIWIALGIYSWELRKSASAITVKS